MNKPDEGILTEPFDTTRREVNDEPSGAAVIAVLCFAAMTCVVLAFFGIELVKHLAGG